MRKQTNRCTCETISSTFELNDEYKSIACTTCWEIVSYELPEKKIVREKKQNIVRGTIIDFANVLQKIRPVETNLLIIMLITNFLC